MMGRQTVIMTNTKNYFAMYTQEGNDEVARLAEKMLADCMIVAESIDHVVHAWEQYVESEHQEFCSKHSEYSDTAVREVMYSFFEKRLGEAKFTNATPENTPLLRS
jgi:uridine kinase